MLDGDELGGPYAQIGLQSGQYVPYETPPPYNYELGDSPQIAVEVNAPYTESGWSGYDHWHYYPNTLDDGFSLALGTAYTYTTLFDYSGPGIFTFQMDGDNVYTTNDIDGDPSFTPYQAEVMGETHSWADQMYGDMDSPEDFAGTNVYVSGGWQNIDPITETYPQGQATITNLTDNGSSNLNTWPENTDFGYQRESASNFAIWDIGCPASVSSGSVISNGQIFSDYSNSSPNNGTSNKIQSAGPDLTNGPYTFEVQAGTGNLIESDERGYALWTPGIVTSDPTYSIMQSDCNYVDYDAWGNNALFNTGTSGGGSNCYMDMENTGNLDLFNSAGTLKWSSYAGWDSSDVNGDPDALMYGQVLSQGQGLWDPTGSYFLTLQSDGNLVLYTAGGTPVWDSWAATGTDGVGKCLVEQSSDGNLVLYPNSNCSGTAVWNAGTEGTGSYDHMLVNPQGTFGVQEVTQSGNEFAWTS